MDAVQASEAAVLQAFDYIPQGLAVFAPDLRLVMSNQRYRDLLDLPERLVAAGTPLYNIALYVARRGDMGTGDAMQLAAERVETLTNAGGSVTQRLGKQGQTLEFRSARLPGGGLVISFADVSPRVDAEAALERANATLEGRVAERTATLLRVNSELDSARKKADAANRDKTRFLAAASHDLLQPLNAARLYTATLIERATESETGALAHSLEASLNAVEEIMSALLDMSRIDSGALKPVAAPFQIRDLIEKVGVEFTPLATEKSIRLSLVDCSGVANADRALGGRSVQNLVSNAIKYTRPGGRVLVGCRRRGGRIRLDVVDSGIGFSQEQHQLLFAEFSRLEQGARMAQGLGLGLSIVDRLVDAMGLTLDVESVEGKGSRFSLYLPKGKIEKADAIEGERAAETASLSGLRILCVDNERAILVA